MAPYQVALLRAENNVLDKVEELLHLIGNPLDQLQPGMRVLIKPNMFQDMPGFYSNPEILVALAKLCHAKGAHVTVGERLKAIYTVLKDSDVHKYAEVISFDDAPMRIVPLPNATSMRVPLSFPEIVLDCDYFIGVPQLRSHAGVLMTNAMKNMIGLLPGFTTRIVHSLGVEESIVDLNLLRKQHLVVTDATTIIEGNYPIAGEPREVGILGASTNATAMDAVMCTVSGYDPFEVEYLRIAHNRKLGSIDMNEIEVLGHRPAEVAFKLNRAPHEPIPVHEGVKVYADTACVQCRRYIAGALEEMKTALDQHEGDLTIISGVLEELPVTSGPVVFIGNCTYPHRDHGIYIEGCPPRAIQVAGLQEALGLEVTPEQKTQFRQMAKGMRA